MPFIRSYVLATGIAFVSLSSAASAQTSTYQLELGIARPIQLPIDQSGRTILPADVALVSEQRLAALDVRYGVVVVVDFSGPQPRAISRVQILQQIPSGRLATDANRLLVLANPLGVAWPFVVTDTILLPEPALNIGFPYADACSQPRGIAVTGLDRDQVIHTFGLNGQRNISAIPSTTGSLTARRVVASVEGMIECGEGQIVFGSSLEPDVRAVDRAGKTRWTFTVPDFVKFRVDSDAMGRTTFAPPPGGADGVLQIFSPTPDVIAVQVWRSRNPETTETWFVDAGRGKVLGKQMGLPRVRSTRGGVALVLNKTAPFIQVVPYRAQWR